MPHYDPALDSTFHALDRRIANAARVIVSKTVVTTLICWTCSFCAQHLTSRTTSERALELLIATVLKLKRLPQQGCKHNGVPTRAMKLSG